MKQAGSLEIFNLNNFLSRILFISLLSVNSNVIIFLILRLFVLELKYSKSLFILFKSNKSFLDDINSLLVFDSIL